jgi:hypothetical protein
VRIQKRHAAVFIFEKISLHPTLGGAPACLGMLLADNAISRPIYIPAT